LARLTASSDRGIDYTHPDFKPKQTGPRTGTLTIKDFNPTSPQIVTLSGSGT
jgi:hypothetical protein